jgi:alkylation response protein AidB-like acyl-CoA dehydrogenase
MLHPDESAVAAPTDVEEAAFRSRVRAFLGAHARPRDGADGADETPGGADAVALAQAFQSAKFSAGLAGLTWPVQYGGQGLDGRFQTIYNDEASQFSTPDGIYTIGFGMCLPTVLTHGTEELKHRYVTPALRGEEIWC